MSVTTLIADARKYAGDVTGQANAKMEAAASLVQAVGYSIPNFYPVALPGAPAKTLDLTAPNLGTVTMDLPAEPTGALEFQDIAAVEIGTLPTLAATLPLISLPDRPSGGVGFTEIAPSINTSLAFPTPPDALMNPLIAAPVLPDRTVPTAPQVSLPTFGALAPVDNTVAPTGLEDSLRGAYADIAPSMVASVESHVDAMLAKHNPRYHEQMARIEAQLSTYLDGGTGLKPAVENAIYERSRSKIEAEARRVRDAAFGDAAARGFTLPTGALVAAVQQARQASADNNAQASREIVVMQAEMEQKNLQFAVTTSTALRSTMLNATLNYMQNLATINGQALDYAKSVLNAIVETYNIAVKAFGVKLDAYKAEAVIFETRLKSALAGVELYTVEIKALEVLTNVDRAKVDVYRARIDALGAYANVYKAQVEAVLGRASLEKLKLDLFSSKVQAFTAQVQGKNAEWQGYTAAIAGETAKAKLYEVQVSAYGAQLQGFNASIQAKTEVVRAAAITNQARAAQYTATLSGYSAVVTARGEKARTQLENQRQEIVAFQAQVQAAVGNAQVQTEYYKAVSGVAVSNAELQMRAMIAGADSQRAFGASIASLGTANAQIYSGLASASMSGMNSLASQSLTE